MQPEGRGRKFGSEVVLDLDELTARNFFACVYSYLAFYYYAKPFWFNCFMYKDVILNYSVHVFIVSTNDYESHCKWICARIQAFKRGG
jgi:hypothetical protein